MRSFYLRYLTPNEGGSPRQSTLLSRMRNGFRTFRKALMDSIQGFGPDNPRPWDPNHPSLKSHLAPHETRATLRLKQAGWPGGEMHRVLKMTATKLIGSLREGMDEESNARASGRQIVGGTVDRGTV